MNFINILNHILRPLEWVVAQLLTLFHHALVTFGMTAGPSPRGGHRDHVPRARHPHLSAAALPFPNACDAADTGAPTADSTHPAQVRRAQGPAFQRSHAT